ncbi:transcriptional regulator [Streptosporangium sp. NPDC049376]|uniref:transcriptional regulator n=1 Tax=Streptosporangium sp. NPDC049376 TaxID=3366192 RepID=UPI0037B21B80
MADEIPPWAARLRDERRSRQWSQRDMAKRLMEVANEETRRSLPLRESIVRNIGNWEAGKHEPKDPYRVLYAHAFGIAEDRLFSDPYKRPRRTPEEILARVLPEGDPKALLTTGTGRRIGMGAVTDLSARVHGLRLADDVLAGGDLIEPAFRELDTAVRLYRETVHTEEVGRSLLVSVGEFAQIAGWVASDAGRHEQAAQAYRLGINATREAGDAALESYLLGSLAYQITNTGDPGEGVQLAHATLKTAERHPSPGVRALAWDRLAWAHTRVGEAQAAMKALGQAATAFAVGSRDADPPYVYWVNTGELQIMEARVYTELGRPLRAVPLLVDVLGRYDASHTRELALYLSWLAVALADDGEPEEAVRVAWRMLNLSGEVVSDRLARRSRVILEHLQPYRDLPEVRELFAHHPMPPNNR